MKNNLISIVNFVLVEHIGRIDKHSGYWSAFVVDFRYSLSISLKYCRLAVKFFWMKCYRLVTYQIEQISLFEVWTEPKLNVWNNEIVTSENDLSHWVLIFLYDSVQYLPIGTTKIKHRPKSIPTWKYRKHRERFCWSQGWL